MKYNVFLKGKVIDLVVLDDNVVQNTNWFNWFNDEENMQNMQQHYFPNTMSEQSSFLSNNILGNRTIIQLGIAHKKDNILIGIIALKSIDYLNKNAEITGFIGEKDYQDFNCFLEANKILIKHGFEQLNLNKIKGGTLSLDICNFYIRMLKFAKEGVLEKEIYKNNEYRSVYLIGLTKSTYIENSSKYI